MSGRSNDKGEELMGMGCSLHRPLGIHIVTILSLVPLNDLYLVPLLAALGGVA